MRHRLIIENQTVSAKMIESKKSQNCENKSNRSKDETIPIVQKTHFAWSEKIVFLCFSKEFNFLRCFRCFGAICGVVLDIFRCAEISMVRHNGIRDFVYSVITLSFGLDLIRYFSWPRK